ncbi:MAG: hypothetical protein IKC51_07820, partial [Myxococcaceae bacterium]|nr:hypothetical protein [Myxococcaceae bacterium]
ARLRGGEGKGRAREGKNMGFSLSHNNELNSVVRGTSAADTPVSIQDFAASMASRTNKKRFGNKN